MSEIEELDEKTKKRFEALPRSFTTEWRDEIKTLVHWGIDMRAEQHMLRQELSFLRGQLEALLMANNNQPNPENKKEKEYSATLKAFSKKEEAPCCDEGYCEEPFVAHMDNGAGDILEESFPGGVVTTKNIPQSTGKNFKHRVKSFLKK